MTATRYVRVSKRLYLFCIIESIIVYLLVFIIFCFYASVTLLFSVYVQSVYFRQCNTTGGVSVC
jgi:hypothetical protein